MFSSAIQNSRVTSSFHHTWLIFLPISCGCEARVAQEHERRRLLNTSDYMRAAPFFFIP
jgi:hypothetical protein